MKLKWSGPVRRKNSFGDNHRIWYAGEYAVRYAKTIDGVAIPKPHYGAWRYDTLLSRHKTKQAAMAACEKHAKRKPV